MFMTVDALQGVITRKELFLGERVVERYPRAGVRVVRELQLRKTTRDAVPAIECNEIVKCGGDV
jgi:hypothetical protein